MKFVLTIILALHFACGDARSPAVTMGINAAIAKARCKGYTQGLNPNDYRVEMVRGEMYDPEGPAPPIAVFRLPCGAYCGNPDFDKGGFVYAAGRFIPPNTLRLPDNAGSEAATNETEHALIYKNDRVYYEQTKFHALGEGHPLLPNCGH